MSQIATILRAVRNRLADPRRWVQGKWSAYRDSQGVVHRLDGAAWKPNCWCLGEITASKGKFHELRAWCENELLATLGEPIPTIYMFNDRPTTAHADVIALLDKTLSRLEAA